MTTSTLGGNLAPLDDFFQSGEGPSVGHRDSETFKAGSREGKCREAIYRDARKAAPEVIFVRDMELKYIGVFKSSIIYRAARDLVRSGVVKRHDIVRNGKPCIALEYCNPWDVAVGYRGEYVSQPKIYRKKGKI